MSKELLTFSILTFITVVFWTAFEAYHVYKTSTVPINLREQIEPLDPKLQKEIITELKARYNEASLPTPVSSPTPTISLKPSPTVATRSASR